MQPDGSAMSARPRNPSWDALVRATEANEDFSDGRIAAALKAIRTAARKEGIPDDDLPHEIEMRCSNYRKQWPTWAITPTAIACHWYRITSSARSLTVEEQTLQRMRQP